MQTQPQPSQPNPPRPQYQQPPQAPAPTKEKSKLWVWLMIIAVVLTANGMVTLLGGVPIKKESQKWEYGAQFATDEEMEKKFTEAGENHWEVVHCRRARDPKNNWGYECIFKRPKQ